VEYFVSVGFPVKVYNKENQIRQKCIALLGFDWYQENCGNINVDKLTSMATLLHKATGI
jgi:hypothetical protein